MRTFIQRVLGWVKAHSLLLRLIFFGSVMVFVANQVINIAHGMSWQAIVKTMSQQNHFTLLLMAALGLLGVIPMLGYDRVTLQTLEQQGKPKMATKDWLMSAWITNTINNLAGFGGLIGASLRANFYGKDVERKKVLATVSKVAFFMFSGISLWALFLLVDLFIFRGDSLYRSYWIWLVGGSLYTPALLLFSYLQRRRLFASMFPKGVLKLILTSFCQWGGALAVFLGIGYLMAIDLPVTDIYPMFLIATLIGMLTMVPGGMGTFDVLMILGLGQVGLAQDQVVVWLLYYRIFYYLLPFLSGIALFATHAGVKFNRFFDNLPRIALQKLAHLVVVLAVYFAGIMMVLLSTVTNLSTLSVIFRFLLPFSFDFLDQTLNLLVGFLLLGLARGLYSKVKKAYLPTILLLGFGIINTVSRTRSLRLIIVYCLIMLAVWLARHEFYRKKFVYSWGALLFDGGLFGVLLIAYALAGFHSGQWWNNQVLGDKFILFPSDELWFSGLIGVALSLLTLFTLQRYLSTTEEQLGTDFVAKRFDQLLERYGGTQSSHRLRLPGYHYYYYQRDGQDRVVFGYQIKGNRCFVLGEPIGEKDSWKAATLSFLKAADQMGYQLAFYKVSEKYVVLLHDLGFNFTKIGETGTVELAEIAFENHAKRQTITKMGYHFTYYPELPKELRGDLQQVSNAWLAGHNEKYFANGRFDWDYLEQAPIGILRNHQNKIVGFIAQQPISDKWVSYDLLRMLPDTPPDLANFMIMAMMEEWQKQGFTYANLGLAPFAHVGEGPFAFLDERLMHVIYNYGNSFYSFQDNFAGKQQYVQKWRSSYFAYAKGGSFYLAALQLLLLIGRGKHKENALIEDLLLE